MVKVPTYNKLKFSIINGPYEDLPFRGDLLNTEQLKSFARNLAKKQKTALGTRNDYLPRRLEYNDRILQEYNNETLSLKNPQYISPAGEWLIDNFYLIEEHIQLARRHFPKSYNRELPCIQEGPFKGLPRVYSIVVKIISHTDAQIDEDLLNVFFEAYQTETILKLGELWAVPIMLRLVLIENLQRIAARLRIDQEDRLKATIWVEKFKKKINEGSSEIIELISEMNKSDITLSGAFVSEFYKILSSPNASLQLVKNWLEQKLSEKGLSGEELMYIESQQQAADHLSVSQSIKSLRFLNTYEWRNFVERSSPVEEMLRKDPAGIYPLMDFDTRDHYRHVIERIAAHGKLEESVVAGQAIRLAETTRSKSADEKHAHVGYYLINKGVKLLIRNLNIQRTPGYRFRQFIKTHPFTFYGGSIFLISLAATMGFIGFMKSPDLFPTNIQLIILAVLFFISVSQLAVFLVNWISSLLLRPDKLPKLDFSKGIPRHCQTIVVIPTLISTKEGIDKLLSDLEIHYLSNRERNLFFGLLSDYSDADSKELPGDEVLLEQARKGIQHLNKKYASANNTLFYLFHRNRTRNNKEKQWMGYERKRGKLMAFNRFLTNGDTSNFAVIEGNTGRLTTIKYVITLDADTQLPPKTACKLIGTMAHPLNKPVVDPKRNIVIDGYGIIQPRISTGLQSSQRTHFARLFSDTTGIDPYTRTISNIYQDLFHEGSFVGKGIYDVEAFEQTLNNRFPDNKILSHDLIESIYVRSGLASEIELYENYPAGYTMDVKRRHRWIRGDWQIIQWLLPRVPVPDRKSVKNPISSLGKWKIADNLRRSLVPPATLLFLIGFCMIFPHYVWIGLLLLVALIILPLLFMAAGNLFRKSKDQSWDLHFREVKHQTGKQLKQILFSLTTLPYEAYLCTEAIIRTLYRLLISGKKLMEWQTSADTDRRTRGSVSAFYKQMWFSPFFAVVCGIIAGLYNPVLLYIFPFLLLWFFAPYIAWKMSKPIALKYKNITEEHTRLLRRIARKTWHFFEVFVNEKENWLPPDNFQLLPKPVTASRTSPTNIGLSLLANFAAYDMGYLTGGKVIERTNQTFITLTKMEKFRGHLFNWYDTRTLEPLYPKYISSVDSGNLAGHLLTVAQGFRNMINDPVYSPAYWGGLLDTVRILKERNGSNIYLHKMEEIGTSVNTGNLYEVYSSLIEAEKIIIKNIVEIPEEDAELQEWSNCLLQDCRNYLNEMGILIPWVKMDHPEKYKTQLEKMEIKDSEYQSVYDFLTSIPTLKEVSELEERICPIIENYLLSFQGDASQTATVESAYYNDCLTYLRQASREANQRIQPINTLAYQSEVFSKMDFGFLYDPEKKLFRIGYNVNEHKSDAGCYDMLASEARLCSYVAIAQGQVPEEHWFSLNRLLIVQQNNPILLSWSGSMFEYLMPLLVMPNFEETLLDLTYKGVVREQIKYGKKFNVPWGISESGYNRTDIQFNYQYKAFGIPSLGLKRGLTKELVIAPYATVLSLPVDPENTCKNMERLTREGHEGNFGYYEAIDYTPSHLPPEESSANINSFMSHHQGMSLVSLSNFLINNRMQKRFIGFPILKAYELLLQEQVPYSISANVISDDSKYEIEGIHPLASNSFRINRVYTQADTSEVNILSNGRYRVMINNSGSGYSRWNNLAVTRWREDATSDDKGFFIYLRKPDTGEFKSIGLQPVNVPKEKYEVRFTQAYAEFTEEMFGMEVKTKVCVSPEDDVELRCITLSNHSSEEITIEVTTYTEVVIAPQEADESHPAFSNLFVQTRYDDQNGTLLATRRARSEEEETPCLFHMMVTDTDDPNEISYETDRNKFIGRGRNPGNPLAMTAPGKLSGNVGAVLDPSFSLRRTVKIAPGESVNICITLGMAESEQTVSLLVEKYLNCKMTNRAFELAWAHNQIILYQLNISEPEAQLFMKLAGALVYMNPSFRAENSLLRNNKRGQSGLWGYSISGDVPLILVFISDSKGMELVRQITLAHSYWRIKGLSVEVVILNEDISVYNQPLHDNIINVISTGVEGFMLEKPGGIFVRSVKNMPPEDLTLFQSVARIILSDKQGKLPEQVDKINREDYQAIPFKPSNKPVVYEQSTFNPYPNLIMHNGYGGFTPDGKEYIITLQDGQSTPAPWCNVIANKYVGTVVSENGSVYTWGENAREFRLTSWSNDPVQDTPGEAFYIRDEQTGQYWSPSPLPTRGKTPYIIRHGYGYTVYEHTEYGIKSELWVYVSPDHPIKFSVLKLKNISRIKRKLSVTGYYEWVLADRRSKSLMHIQTAIDIQSDVLYARNYYNSDFAGKIAFIDAGESRTYTADRKEFLGQNGNLSAPQAMKNAHLGRRTGAGTDPCGVVQVVADLTPDEEQSLVFKLGYAHNKEDMRRLVALFRQPEMARKSLEAVWELWNKIVGTVYVETPDPAVNIMANGRLLYQTLSCRIWGRSGFYQSGGAFGFRDQLQDVMALIHTRPEIIREQILLAASRQFTKGDVQHWWHPPVNRGVRTHFSDDYLWLPYVTYHYVTSSGDTGILDETVSFITGRELRPEEESYYDLPLRSDETGSIYEHCRRSIHYGLKFGIHGLPLMGCGDWNDGMNLVGKNGKGESVWLAFFLYDVLSKFSTVARIYNDESFARFCVSQADELKNNIHQNAWDGRWYKRAYFDDGTPLGSASNEECYIDSIPQSWSVISNAGQKGCSLTAMEEVYKQLVDPKGQLIRLFTPPFDKSTLNPGYIKGYIPGVRENGGQYSHAAIWTVWAYALLGENERAWKLFDLINPMNHGSTPDKIETYKTEPYVIAADVYTAEQHLGRGGWTWYTGSAAWMYRLLVEMLLGITKLGNKLQFSPLLRTEWKEFKVNYRYYNTIYNITFTLSNTSRLILDGKEQNNKKEIQLEDDGKEHIVNVQLTKD